MGEESGNNAESSEDNDNDDDAGENKVENADVKTDDDMMAMKTTIRITETKTIMLYL